MTYLIYAHFIFTTTSVIQMFIAFIVEYEGWGNQPIVQFNLLKPSHQQWA